MSDGFIPYGKQWIDEDDVRALLEVLRSDWLTQGPKVAEFERLAAAFCGVEYAVAVSSGTAALHLACLAAGIGQGDGVITSVNTFLASANCALYVGARPVLVDIEPGTHNLDLAGLQECLRERTAQDAPRLKAIVTVHFAGQPCDMPRIYKLAKEYGLIVIEDAAHALGAEYQCDGQWVKVGSCRHSDMTVFSFHPVKHITTAEGGMILTNDVDLYERLLMLRSHGVTKKAACLKRTGEGPWYYEMQMLGFNYRISDLQCALGISQWGKLQGFLARRRELAARYDDALQGAKHILTPFEREGVRSSYHLYVLQLDFEGLQMTRAQLMRELAGRGVGTQVHYIPLHLQPYYQEMLGYREGDFPESERYYAAALSIPMYPALSFEQQDYVIEQLLRCCGRG